ncbi:MAG: VanZ family protein [Proteobacteria bacterium]|nr:VanZ family protein [Pseudomonadota bacterium]
MNKLLNLIKIYWLVLTVIILVGITLLSLWPLEELPSVPGTDKTHHLIAYALLIFPVALGKPNKWFLAGFLFVCYSGAIELLQPFVNRYGEWLDMAANSAGLVCGILVAKCANHFYPGPLDRVP